MNKLLIKELAFASGLPEEFVTKNLEELLFKYGFDPDQAGLEQIREVLSNLLHDLILSDNAN
jgi:hypothetical protein